MSDGEPHLEPPTAMGGDEPAHLAPLVDRLHRELLDRIDGGDDPAEHAAPLVDEIAGLLSARTREELRRALLRRATGLGPLEDLLADPDVDEIMVCGTRPIWVERGGRIVRTDAAFDDDRLLREVIDRLLSPIDRRVDAASPICDARMLDGSRVNVTLPPLAVDGTALTIRRFRRGGRSVDELVDSGAWDDSAAATLRDAVRERRTILICGATGSGKTTVLGALAREIDPAERLVTIEDAAELDLGHPHVIRLEARPANLEGDGAVAIRDLVRNAMRMRPDRVIVGEVRGPEALDLLLALSSGHAGGLSTVHAGSPEEALRRLELLTMLAGVELPLAAVRELVRGGIDLVAHQERGRDGKRRLVEIAEVAGADRELRTCWRAAGTASR